MRYIAKNTLIALCVFLISNPTTITASALAQISKPYDPIYSIVGLACHKAGSCVLSQSYTAGSKPSYEITLVYSKHPILQANNNEVLQLIAETINSSEKKYDESFLYDTCATSIKKYFSNALKDRRPKDLKRLRTHALHDLVILCIKLDSIRTTYNGFVQESEETQRGIIGLRAKTFGDGAFLFNSVTFVYNTHHPSDTSITNAQEEAERAQHDKPESPIHLVIDLKKWRECIALTS